MEATVKIAKPNNNNWIYQNNIGTSFKVEVTGSARFETLGSVIKFKKIYSKIG